MTTTTPLIEKLNAEMKDAMRSKDAQRLSCIRMVKARVMEVRTSKGFSGEVDDALYERVIAQYVKQLQKTLSEFGDRDDEIMRGYRYEVGYLGQYLPKKLDLDATRTLVVRIAGEIGATEMRHMGKLMGGVMRGHKDEVDAGLVKKVAAEILRS